MAISGSYNYNATAQYIIDRAARICQMIGVGESLEVSMVAEARETLNDICQSWASDGMPIWAIKDGLFALTASKRTYKMGTAEVAPEISAVSPLKLLQAFLRDNTDATNPVDVPLNIITREEYNLLSSKLQEGRPNSIYHEPMLSEVSFDYSIIKLYPVPDTETATNCLIGLIYQRPFADLDSATDSVDFPREWYRALVWALASDMAYEAGLPFAERSMIEKKAERLHRYAIEQGSQEGSMFLRPEPRWYNRVFGISR